MQQCEPRLGKHSRLIGCAILGALVVGTGCRSRAASENSAPPAPSGTASAPETAAPVDACARLWRAAQVDVAFREQPEPTREPASGPLRSRRFTVAKQQRGAYRYKDQWASVLEYQQGGTTGAISYTLTVPDALADLTGRAVRWDSYRKMADCLGGDGEHPALIAGDVLRDEADRLLLFTSPSLPLAPDGSVTLPPGLDFQMRWEEAGCTASPESVSRGVQLQVVGRDGAPVTVRVGETRTVELPGGRYEVRVASAQADTHGHCGQAVLALYREGLRQQLPPE